MMDFVEEWRDIPHYEGKYQVSNLGRIWSVKSQLVMKKQINNCGYECVLLVAPNGKRKNELIHRLVALTFINNPNNLPQVNHKDENKKNNTVDNLEWVSAKQNINYGTHRERIIETMGHKVQQYSLNGKLINTFPSQNEASRQTGVNRGNIQCCLKGSRKTAGGFIWKNI